MADLIQSLKYLSDDELRMEIALIDNVNFANAVKETGQKILAGVIDVANAFAEAFVNKSAIEYEVKKVSDKVNESFLKLKVDDREQLEGMMRTRLFDMARGLTGKALDEDIDNEQLSKLLIGEAGSGYNINKYISPAHKIEEISIKYNNAFLVNLKEQINMLNDKEKKECAVLIEKKLNSATMEVKRSVQEALMPASFNGIGLINAIRKQKSLGKLELLVDLLGEDAFMGAQVEVKTMYQALKSLNRITRLQVARLIWKIANKANKKFYVEPSLMPSYVSFEQKEMYAEADKEFAALMGQLNEARKDFEKGKDNVLSKEKQLSDARDAYEKASEDYDKVQLEFTKLEAKKDAYIGGKRPEDETKRYYANVNDTKRQLDRGEEEYERRKKRLHELTTDLTSLKSKCDELEKHCQAVEKSAKKEIDFRSSELRVKWTAYFYKFSFEEEVFKKAVCLLDRDELRMLEETMKEAHDSVSMLAVAEDESKIYAYMGSRKPAIVTYEDRMIKDIGYDR